METSQLQALLVARKEQREQYHQLAILEQGRRNGEIETLMDLLIQQLVSERDQLKNEVERLRVQLASHPTP